MKVLENNQREFQPIVQVCTGMGNSNKGCQSKLEVSLEDLRYFAQQDYPWRTAHAAVCFKCPVCNELTDISKQHWPKSAHTTLGKFSSAWKNGEE